MKRDVESKLASELIGTGYARLDKKLFSAPWSSSQVDHRISTYWLTKYGYRVGIAFGLLHHEAHKFGFAMMRMFGSPIMREDPKPASHGSFIGFSLGNLCSWPTMWSLSPTEIGADQCIKVIIDGLQETAFPLIGRVNDNAKMCDFLTQTEIDAFFQANGLVLAAQAMFLGKRLDFSHSRVVNDLAPVLRVSPLPIDESVSIDDFFHQVWTRA